MVEKENRIWMEVSSSVDGGADAKRTDISDLEAELLSIDQPFELEKMAELAFQEW